MKYRFAASEQIRDLDVNGLVQLTVDEFVLYLTQIIFKEKAPTCTFKVTNYDINHMIQCEKDIPIVKKDFINVFAESKTVTMVEKPKKKKRPRRWKSKSPVKRRWRSHSPRTKRRRYSERWC